MYYTHVCAIGVHAILCEYKLACAILFFGHEHTRARLDHLDLDHDSDEDYVISLCSSPVSAMDSDEEEFYYNELSC